MHKLYYVTFSLDSGNINGSLYSHYLFKEGPPPPHFKCFNTFEELYEAVSSHSFPCWSAGLTLLHDKFVTFRCDNTNWTITAKTFKTPIIIKTHCKECSTKDYKFDFFKENLSADDFIIFLQEHGLTGGTIQ